MADALQLPDMCGVLKYLKIIIQLNSVQLLEVVTLWASGRIPALCS